MSLSKPTFWSHAKFSVSYGFPSGSPPGTSRFPEIARRIARPSSAERAAPSPSCVGATPKAMRPGRFVAYIRAASTIERGGHARDLLGALGRPLGRLAAHLVEAQAPLLDERLVVELLLDHHVDEAQRERAVRPRPHGEVEVGARGGLRDARVDHDQLGALRLAVLEPLPGGRRRLGRVRAPDHDALADARVGRLVDRVPAVDGGLGDELADAAVPALTDEVRGAEVAGEAPARPVARPLVRAAERRDRLGAVARADLAELGGDLVERLLPGDPLPLVLAAGADALQRVVEAVGVIVQLDAGGALDAELALRDGVLLVAVEAHRMTGLVDLDQHPAVLGAERAERPPHVPAEGEACHEVSERSISTGRLVEKRGRPSSPRQGYTAQRPHLHVPARASSPPRSQSR